MTEIDDLLDRIEPPRADVADDIARGEQALRRRHWWQVAAAGASVVALAGAGVALSGHDVGSRDVGFSGRPGSAATGPARTHHAHAHQLAQARRLLKLQRQLGGLPQLATVRRYHDVLAEHLDPQGDLLAPSSNEQSGGRMLGSKFDWNHGGMLEIVVGRSWAAAGSFYLLEDAGMHPTTYDGHPARVSTAGDDTVVSVQHADGTVVTLIASTSFGNNGTSTSSTGLTQHQLLEAAADPRLTLPPALG